MAASQASGSAPPPAHPAFPSLLPKPDSPQPPAPPATPSAVFSLISSHNTLPAIIHGLIPALNGTAAGKAHAGSKDKAVDRASAVAKGEEVLACFDLSIDNSTDQDVTARTAALVYIMLHINHRDQPTYNLDLLNLALKVCLLGDVNQLHACGPRLGDLAWGILRLARDLQMPEASFALIQALLDRAIPRRCLSGVHAAFLEACLLTRRYDVALPLLDEILVDVKTFSPSYLDVLTFFHHAGLLASAVKRWDKAVEMYSMAVSVPTSAASAIQLACAKRAILCGLLNDGKFPKYTAGVVTRVIERNAKEYLKVAEAFVKEDWRVVRNSTGNKEFKDDCNIGLLHQVINSIPLRRILRLKGLYSKMTLAQLAQKLDLSGPDSEREVQQWVEYMISAGYMGANLDTASASPIVTFLEDQEDYTSTEALSKLRRVTETAELLEMELTRGKRELGVSREYLKKQGAFLEVAGGKARNKDGKMDDFDSMLAAEELGMPGGFGRSGAKGKGLRGVGGNMGDMGF